MRNAGSKNDWRTRAAAIRGLVFLRTKDGVGLLIGRLDQESSRLKGDILEGLQNLTGKMLGMTAEPWKAWWRAASERFEPGDHVLLLGDPDLLAAAACRFRPGG